MEQHPLDLEHLLDYSRKSSIISDLDSLEVLDEFSEIPVAAPYNLFISSMRSALDLRALKQKQIKTVIYIGMEIKPEHCLKGYSSANIDHHHYVLEDHPDAPFEEIFDSSYATLDRALQRGNVLLHCQAGISRSVSVLMYYMMKKKIFSNHVDCLRFIKEYRPVADPNEGFLKKIYWATIN